MTAHVHAALMLQYAQDAAETSEPWRRWEGRPVGTDGEWRSSETNPGWLPHYEYRRKPRTHTVNGFEVPEPMRDAPQRGARYWVPVIDAEDYAASTYWSGADHDTYDTRCLERGLVHATKEAAIANAKAMCGVKP